jgi:hypothetical protein
MIGSKRLGQAACRARLRGRFFGEALIDPSIWIGINPIDGGEVIGADS